MLFSLRLITEHVTRDSHHVMRLGNFRLGIGKNFTGGDNSKRMCNLPWCMFSMT